MDNADRLPEEPVSPRSKTEELETARAAADAAREALAHAEAMLAKAKPELDAASTDLALTEAAIGQQRMSGTLVIRRSADIRIALEQMRRRIERTRREREEATSQVAQLGSTIETTTSRRARIEVGAEELRRSIAFAQAELTRLHEQVERDQKVEQEATQQREQLQAQIVTLEQTEVETAQDLASRESAAADVLKAADDLQRELAEGEQHFANARLAHRQARSRHQSAMVLVEQSRAAERRAMQVLAQAREDAEAEAQREFEERMEKRREMEARAVELREAQRRIESELAGVDEVLAGLPDAPPAPIEGPEVAERSEIVIPMFGTKRPRPSMEALDPHSS
jgi:chromosome segregation ATPase